MQLKDTARKGAEALRASTGPHPNITIDHLAKLLDSFADTGAVPEWKFGDGSSALIFGITVRRILTTGFCGDAFAKALAESQHAIAKHYNGEPLRRDGLALALTLTELLSRRHPKHPRTALEALKDILTTLNPSDQGLKSLVVILNACL